MPNYAENIFHLVNVDFVWYKWLRSFDQRLRENIEYAICLNSIGSSPNELWLHVSKPPENANIKQIFDVSSSFGSCILIA